MEFLEGVIGPPEMVRESKNAFQISAPERVGIAPVRFLLKEEVMRSLEDRLRNWQKSSSPGPRREFWREWRMSETLSLRSLTT